MYVSYTCFHKYYLIVFGAYVISMAREHLVFEFYFSQPCDDHILISLIRPINPDRLQLRACKRNGTICQLP